MVIPCFHDTSISYIISTKRSYKDEFGPGMTQTGTLYIWYFCTGVVTSLTDTELKMGTEFILKQREQVQALCWHGTVWDAGKLPIHPSPNPMLTPIFQLEQNVGLGGGGWLGCFFFLFCFFFFRIVYCIPKQFVSNILLTHFKLVEKESCVHFKSKPNLVDQKRSHFLKILFAARRSCSCPIKHWRNKVW